MFKSLFSLAVLICVSTSQAEMQYYAGASGAYNISGHNFISGLMTGKSKDHDWERHSYFHTQGHSVGLKLGAGNLINNRIYIGLEGFGELAHVKGAHSFHYPITDHKMHLHSNMRHSLGVHAHLGVLLPNQRTLPYLIGGIVKSQWHYSAHSEPNPCLGEPKIQTANKYLNGHTYGLGVRHKVSDHSSVGLEYTYTRYKHMGYAIDNLQNKVNNKTGYLVNVKHNINKVALTYTYHF